MVNKNFDKLREAASEVSDSVSSEDKIRCLNRAFELFSEETARLERAYGSLKDQFLIVNGELEETNTHLNQKVDELDALTAYLESILTNIAQGLLFIDTTGRVTTYNKAAEELLNVPANKVLNKPFSEHFRDDLFGFSMKQALASLNCPRHMIISVDGKRHLEIDTTIVDHDRQKTTGDQVNLTGIIVLIRDITTIHRLQKLTERNDRMKELGEMAAMVAHEIRNPLGGIKGFASLLRRDVEGDPAKLQMVNHIIEGTDILNRLVTNVLNHSRPMEVRAEQVDLVALLKGVESHLKADEAIQGKIVIELSLPPEPLLAMIDPQYYKASVLNLVLNATQAMPEGGTLTIRLSQANGQAVVEVSDTGVGISPENLEKIFSPFFTTKEEGNGFGLTEVHKVITSHGGTIEVTSTVGTGSTFTVKTPITGPTI